MTVAVSRGEFMRFVGLLVLLAAAGFVCGVLQWAVWALVVVELFLVVTYIVAWSVLFPDPFRHLGAMTAATDDPLMSAAIERAIATLPELLDELYPAHPEGSMVKFRSTTDQDVVEDVWGDLVSIDGDELEIRLRTPPGEREEPFKREEPVEREEPSEGMRRVRLEDVVDWQVELADGRIRGGRTNLALFRIYEREKGRMHPQFLPHVARFVDR